MQNCIYNTQGILSCQKNEESFEQQQCSHESFINLQQEVHNINVEDTTEDGLLSDGKYIGFCVRSNVVNIFKKKQCWIVNGIKIGITDIVKNAHPKDTREKHIVKYTVMQKSNFRVPKYSMVIFKKTQC